MKIKCHRIQTLLALRPADRSADEQARIEAHLATCPVCAAQARLYAEQDRLIRSAPSARLTSAQRSQFFSQIQQERKRHKMYAKLSAIVGTAAAVAVIIGIGFGARILLPSDTLPASPTESLWPAIEATEEKSAFEWTFADEIRLTQKTESHPFLGISNPADPSGPGLIVPPTNVQISLAWDLVSQPTADWTAFVHLEDETGTLIAQSDVALDLPEQPCEKDAYDSTCRFFSTHTIELPGGTPLGLYIVRAGIYNRETGERAFTTDEPGQQDAAILGQVEIVSGETLTPMPSTLYKGYFQWPITPHDILSWTFHDPRSLDHPGIDIAAEEGTPVTAADGGVVTFAGWEEKGYGYMVVIEHGDGWASYYGHLSEISVEVGQMLQQGDLLGKSGSTGSASGPHLHFELRHWNQPVDPLSYLPSVADHQPAEDPPTTFVWPVEGYITQPYSPEHPAIDIAAEEGTPVVAATAGVVVAAGWDDAGAGNFIVINHGDKTFTRYTHLLDYQVKAGDTVSQGQQIGRVGSTGMATGPHLHFEVTLKIDPQALLPE
jgi:murein DD-endopeptidase MepM/ murein hydrolase activator NlpD